MLKQVGTVLCVLSLSAPALAEPPEAVLSEIVATASRWEEPVETVAQDITIISRSDIEKKGAPFLVDLLRVQADLQVVQTGGAGSIATVRMRGGGSNQVLVLVDGLKINSPSTGSADLSGLLTSDIERIEIIKGAQSTLYGSEAMAGVVNIITRKGAGPLKGDLSVEAGSYSTVKTAGTVSGSTERLNYRLAATWLDTDGISTASSGTERDEYTNKSVSARIGANPTDYSAVELNLRYGKDKAELDDYDFFGAGPIDSLNFLQDRENYLVAATGKIFASEKYEQSLSLSYFEDDIETTDPAVAWNNYRITNKTEILDWQHTVDLKPLTVTAGFAYRRESTDNEGVFDESINNKAGYLNAKVAVLADTLIFNAGVRYDDHSTFGNEVTYRTGMLYHLKPLEMRFKANFGTGFRAPSLNELYWPFYGNRDLEPEKSTGYDVTVEKDLLNKKLVLGATWFSQRYRNLIQTNAAFTAENIGRAQTDGVEVNVSARPLEELRVNLAYAWLDAVNRDTGAFLALRPRNKVTSSVDYTIAKLTVGGDYQFVSRRYDQNLGRYLSPYSLVNLRGSYHLHKNLAIFARIDNLLDKDYEEAAGYGTPGLSVYGGIRVTF